MQVNLSRRNLIDFDSSAFCTDDDREVLRSITCLDISFNSISSLQGLYWLSNLTSLNISHNSITSLRGLPLTLRELNASFNVLTDLEGISPLLKLEILIVSHNQIINLRGLPSTVRILDASSNRITSLSGLEKCTLLEEFQVRQNMIQKVDELIALKSLHLLKALTLAENPVTQSKRYIISVYDILPISLQVHDLPSICKVINSSLITSPNNYFKHVEVNPTLSLQKSTLKDTINISDVSSVHKTRISQEDISNENYLKLIPNSLSISPKKNFIESEDEAIKEEFLLNGKKFSPSIKSKISSSSSKTTHQTYDLPREVPILTGTTTTASISSNINTSNTSKSGYSSIDTSSIQNSKPHINSEVNVSVSNICDQRLTQNMLEKLQLELEEYKKMCISYKKENEDLHLRVKQLQSTVEQQNKVNVMLLEKNKKLQQMFSKNSLEKEENILPPTTTTNNNNNNNNNNKHEENKNVNGSVREVFFKRENTKNTNKNKIHSEKKKFLLEQPSLEEKVELRRGARSLAALLMSLVPPTTNKLSRSISVPSTSFNNNNTNNNISKDVINHQVDSTREKNIANYNNNINANSSNNTKGQRSLSAGGRKRTVSFGEFAYYSPPY